MDRLQPVRQHSRSFDQLSSAFPAKKHHRSLRRVVADLPASCIVAKAALGIYRRPLAEADQTTATSHSDYCKPPPSTLSRLGSSSKTCLPPATAHTGRTMPCYHRATKCTLLLLHLDIQEAADFDSLTTLTCHPLHGLPRWHFPA